MTSARKLLTASLFATSLVLSACGGGVGSISISPNPSITSQVPDGGGSATAIPVVQHVAVVVLENTNYADVLGSPNAPYMNSLLSRGALAAKYYANTHPSIPNYFTMTTGLPVTNDDSTTTVVTNDNILRQLNAAGKSWRFYAESLPSPGYLGPDQGQYLRHHNPAAYFSDVQNNAAQAANIVPFSQLSSDMAGTLPNYLFIVPNAQHDLHDCGDGTITSCTFASRLQTADNWLQSNINPLLNNAQFQASGLLIVVFDESSDDFTYGGGHVFTALVGSRVKAGYTGNSLAYDHRSLFALTLHALGITSAPNGADAAPQMSEFFQ